MEVLYHKRQCAQCQKYNNFLIVLNKCNFEICYHHFEEIGTAKRFKCPVCKDHDVSLNECISANKNSITIKFKELHDRLDKLDKKLSKYDLLRNNTEDSVYEHHTDLFEQLDKRRVQVKSEINKEIDTFYEELKGYYKLKLDKQVRFIRSNLSTIEPNQKEIFMNKLKQASGRPIKDQFLIIDSFTKQVEENENKIDKIFKTLTDPSDLVFVPGSNIKLNFQNIFGRLKSKEKKFISSLDELKLKKIFRGHNAAVISVMELINGDIISASHDKTIKVWDKDSSECMYTLSGHSDQIKDIKAIDTNLYSVGKDKCVFVWKVNDRNYHEKIQTEEVINCLAVKENGDLMTGSKDGYIRFYNSESGNKSELKAHERSVYCILLLSPSIFVSCSADQTIKVWHMESQTPKKLFKGHTSYVWCMEKVSEKKFLSGSKDKKIILWNIEKENSEMIYEGHEDIVRCIKMKSNEEFLSCSADGTVIEWDLNNSKPKKTLTLNKKEQIYSIFITDENELIIGTDSGALELWSSNLY